MSSRDDTRKYSLKYLPFTRRYSARPLKLGNRIPISNLRCVVFCCSGIIFEVGVSNWISLGQIMFFVLVVWDFSVSNIWGSVLRHRISEAYLDGCGRVTY